MNEIKIDRRREIGALLGLPFLGTRSADPVGTTITYEKHF